MKKQIPEFTDDDEAERFVDTADLAQYDLSGFKPTRFEFQVKAAQLNMRLPQTLLDAVKKVAKAKGIPYTRFVRETLEHVITDQNDKSVFASRIYAVGNIQVTAQNDEIIVSGRSISLPSKQRMILELFISQKGVILTKEILLHHIYGVEDQPEPKLIDVLMYNLRKTLSQAGADPMIRIVWGRGYMLQSPEQVEEKRIASTSTSSRRKKLQAAS